MAPGHLGQELATPPAREAAQAAHGGGQQQQGGGRDPGGLALRHRLHRPLLPPHHPRRLSHLPRGRPASSSDLLKAGKPAERIPTKCFSAFLRHRAEEGFRGSAHICSSLCCQFTTTSYVVLLYSSPFYGKPINSIWPRFQMEAPWMQLLIVNEDPTLINRFCILFNIFGRKFSVCCCPELHIFF